MSNFHATDLMIDCETLGTRTRSVILSIGLVAFRADDPDFKMKTRMIQVDAGDQPGRLIEHSTLRFWMEQEVEARQALFGGYAQNVTTAVDWVEGFCKSAFYVETHPKDEDFDTLERVWSNGAAFDIPLLEDLIFSQGKTPYWTYKMARCLRTLRDLYPEVPRREPKVAHDAVEDAVAQALEVIDVYKRRAEIALQASLREDAREAEGEQPVEPVAERVAEVVGRGVPHEAEKAEGAGAPPPDPDAGAGSGGGVLPAGEQQAT